MQRDWVPRLLAGALVLVVLLSPNTDAGSAPEDQGEDAVSRASPDRSRPQVHLPSWGKWSVLALVVLLMLAVAIAHIGDQSPGLFAQAHSLPPSGAAVGSTLQRSYALTPTEQAPTTARVLLTLGQLAPADGVLRARVEVAVPPDLSDQLFFNRDPYDPTNGCSLILRTSSGSAAPAAGNLTLNPACHSDPLLLVLRIGTELNAPQIVQSIPVAALVHPGASTDGYITPGTNFATTVSIPITGSQEAFPNDWYTATLVCALTLPDMVSLKPLNGSAIPDGFVPTEVQMATDATLADFSVAVRRDNSHSSVAQTALQLLMQRNDWTAWFTYLSASAPFALALIVGFLLLDVRGANRGTDHRKDAFQVAVTVCVAIVTLPPLRSVLVPGTLAGITRVDYILLVEVILTVLATIVSGLRWAVGSHQAGNSREENGVAAK